MINLLATLRTMFGKPEATEEDIIADVNAAIEGNKRVDGLSESIGNLTTQLTALEDKFSAVKTVDEGALIEKISAGLLTKFGGEITSLKEDLTKDVAEELNKIKLATTNSVQHGIFIPEGANNQPNFRTVKVK
jgi:hypothetical protein